MLQTVNKPYRQHKVTFLFLDCMLVDFNQLASYLTFVMSVQHATTELCNLHSVASPFQVSALCSLVPRPHPLCCILLFVHHLVPK